MNSEKGIRRIFIVMCVLFWAVISVFSVYYRYEKKDSGISKVNSVQDIYKLKCRVDYAFGKNKVDEKQSYKSFVRYEDSYVKDTLKSHVILIGTATGKIEQKGTSFGQEIVVDAVRKGDEDIIGKNIMVYSFYGMRHLKDGSISYLDINSPMRKGEKYVVFLKKTSLSEVTQGNKWSVIDGYFTYIKLNCNIDKPLKWSKESLLYDYKDNEMFVTSHRIAKQLYRIKQDILTELSL